MNVIAPPAAEAISLFRSVVAEERWLQGQWHRHDGGNGGGGKDYLCLAAAWGKPGEINGTEDCPTDLYPAWLFELMPTLDDGVSAEDVPWLFKGFGERADGMARLSPETWERIRTGFMIASIRQSIDAAKPVQPDPVPDYWQQVVDACEGVIAAMEGKADLEAARAAARAAAWAANRAAARAAEAAAEAAAWAAAWAAEAAAWAAAWAAEAAAYRKVAETLFALIDAEIAASGSE